MATITETETVAEQAVEVEGEGRDIQLNELDESTTNSASSNLKQRLPPAHLRQAFARQATFFQGFAAGNRDYVSATFNPLTFISEWIIATFPISVVLVAYTLGSAAARNRDLLPNPQRLFNFISIWVVFLLLLAINIIYFVDPPPCLSLFEVLFADLLWVVKAALNATKYAFLSRGELAELNKKANLSRASRQEISNWANLSNEMFINEYEVAMVRQQIDLHRSTVFFKNLSAENFRASFNAAVQVHNGGKTPEGEVIKFSNDNVNVQEFSGSIVAKQFLFNSVTTSSFTITGYSLFIAAALAALPIIIRAGLQEPPVGGNDWNAWVLFCLSTPVNIFLYFNMYSFLLVTIIDLHRRRNVQEQMLKLIQDGYIPPTVVLKHLRDNEEHLKELRRNSRRSSILLSKSSAGSQSSIGTPETQQKSTIEKIDHNIWTQPIILDCSVPKNIITWWEVRLVLQEFGSTLNKRLNVAFVIFAFAVAALTGVAVVLGVFNFQGFYIILAMSIANIIAVVFLFIFMVIEVGQTNLLRKEQAVEALKQKTVLENFQTDSMTMSLQECINIESSIKLLTAVSHQIVHENNVNPAVIFVFHSASQLLRIIILVGLAAFSLTIRQISS